MKRVILDTNFLIDLGRFGVSIDEIDKIMNERYELITFSSIVNELKSIAGTQKEEAKFAKLAIMIMDLRRVNVMQVEGKVDQSLTDFAAKERDVIVGTNDMELRKNLQERGVRCIYFRGKKRLEMR